MNFRFIVLYMWDLPAILHERRSKFEKIAISPFEICYVTQHAKELKNERKRNTKLLNRTLALAARCHARATSQVIH